MTAPDPDTHNWGCSLTDHMWVGPVDVDGVRFVICERCAATIEPPEVPPGRRAVAVPNDYPDP